MSLVGTLGPLTLDPFPGLPLAFHPPQSAFQADMSEIILCQKEVDLALRNLHSWMKDQPVAKNLVSCGLGPSQP